MMSYKPQEIADEVIHVYTEKQSYHTSQNQNDHAHLFHDQEYLKQQFDHVKSEFYNITLDLSHDDIQQTLSANMPVSCSNADQLLRYLLKIKIKHKLILNFLLFKNYYYSSVININHNSILKISSL